MKKLLKLKELKKYQRKRKDKMKLENISFDGKKDSLEVTDKIFSA